MTNGYHPPEYLDEGPPSEPPDDTPSGTTAKRSDVANAETLLRLHGENLRYVGAWRKWLAWDGRRWQLDTDALAMHYAVETTRVMLNEASQALHDLVERIKREGLTDELKDLKAEADKDFAHAAQSQAARKLASMLTVTSSFRQLATRQDHLDTDPWMLNCGNGTLDLRTGKLFPHMRSELITLVTPIAYDEDAKCPTWDAFLERVQPAAGMRAYIQRLAGYTLTGVTTEQCLAFHHGSGANGKSTFLATLHQLVGDYGTAAHPRLIFRSRGDGDRHLTERASLFRKRFVTCPETSEAMGWDEGTVKDLTGDDLITCRRMREDEWTYRPTHKLHIAGNERPIVRATDDGFWRRMHLVPWAVTIPAHERDQGLAAKLHDELPGILAWAVRGTDEWRKNRLAPPADVLAATEAYRSASDTGGLFLRAACELEDAATTSKKDFREAYEAWSREQGYEPLGARRMAEVLRRHGVQESTAREGMRVVTAWRGVRLVVSH